MSGAAGSWPRPFAVGVLGPPDADDPVRRSRARLDVAMDAYKHGYFLVDTIETSGAGTGYLAAELLAGRTEADALVVRGRVDDDWLCSVADRHGLVVLRAQE
jgi:hypothetical protein